MATAVTSDLVKRSLYCLIVGSSQSGKSFVLASLRILATGVVSQIRPEYIPTIGTDVVNIEENNVKLRFIEVGNSMLSGWTSFAKNCHLILYMFDLYCLNGGRSMSYCETINNLMKLRETKLPIIFVFSYVDGCHDGEITNAMIRQFIQEFSLLELGVKGYVLLPMNNDAGSILVNFIQNSMQEIFPTKQE